MTEGTLVIVNPYAGSGRAGRTWHKLEPMMIEAFGELVVAITEHPEEVVEHLDKAYAAGLRRVLALGGDGTNYIVMNAILELQEHNSGGAEMTFGHMPLGTGQAFAHFLGMPKKPHQAVQWLAKAQPKPVDVGCLEYDGQLRYFLNVASVGMGGEIDKRVNRMRVRRSWTYWWESVRAFLTYNPPEISIRIDGEVWYEGSSWLVALANAAFFGREMMIAPDARIDDGLLDVVLVEGTPRFTAIKAINSVYSGRHLLRDDVQFKRGAVIEIEANGEMLPIDLDGEFADGRQIRAYVKPGALKMLS